jgi:hypothetical protein
MLKLVACEVKLANNITTKKKKKLANNHRICSQPNFPFLARSKIVDIDQNQQPIGAR